MNRRTKGFVALVVLSSLVLVMVGGLAGCKKKAEPVKPPADANKAVKAAVAGIVEIAQKVCPVKEGPINKAIFTEYKGQKVYFCCAECKAAFEKEAEKYIAQLPQFKK